MNEVYQLKGGIINYLNSTNKEESKWNGECYVFDQRVSVIHGSKQGSYSMCHACRIPLSDNEKKLINTLKVYLVQNVMII